MSIESFEAQKIAKLEARITELEDALRTQKKSFDILVSVIEIVESACNAGLVLGDKNDVTQKNLAKKTTKKFKNAS